MSRSATAERPAIVDPRDTPVHVIDQATFHGIKGSLLDVTLCTLVAKPVGPEQFVDEAVVAARLRFDLSMAKAFVRGLSQQIALAEAGHGPIN